MDYSLDYRNPLGTAFDRRYETQPEPLAADLAEVLARQGEIDEHMERQVME